MAFNGRKPLAYFFLGPQEEVAKTYPHSAVVFAEGLLDMGWSLCADVRAWQTSPGGGYLFPSAPLERAEDADLIVFGEDYFFLHGSDRLPAISLTIKAPRICLERSDLGSTTRWIYGLQFSKLDLILRCHSSGYFKYPGNVKPTVYGLSRRIVNACAQDECKERENAIWGFNHKEFPHSVRRWAERRVLPIVASRFHLNSRLDVSRTSDTPYGNLMLEQTKGRHHLAYFERLKGAIICACFGGWFLFPWKQEEATLLSLSGRKLLSKVSITTPVIAQWDSWRLWEAFAAGAVVLHVDFAQSKFLTGGPLPEPMKHYIPVDLTDPCRTLFPLLDQRDELLRIGKAGRSWALENYTPRPIVERTLSLLGFNSPKFDRSVPS